MINNKKIEIEIERVKECRYLGCIITENRSLETEVRHAKTTFSRMKNIQIEP